MVSRILEGAIEESVQKNKKEVLKAKDLVKMLKKDSYMKASAKDEIWDTVDRYVNPKVITVNVGHGFEDAVAVMTEGGWMIYIGHKGKDYILTNYPSWHKKSTGDNQALLFNCQEMIFIRGI